MLYHQHDNPYWLLTLCLQLRNPMLCCWLQLSWSYQMHSNLVCVFQHNLLPQTNQYQMPWSIQNPMLDMTRNYSLNHNKPYVNLSMSSSRSLSRPLVGRFAIL